MPIIRRSNGPSVPFALTHRIQNFWADGMNTAEIAALVGQPEAKVYGIINTMYDRRYYTEAQRGLPEEWRFQTDERRS